MDDFEIWSFLVILVFGIAGIILTIRREGRRSRARLHKAYAAKVRASYYRGRSIGYIEGQASRQLDSIRERLNNLQVEYGDRPTPAQWTESSEDVAQEK